MKHKEAGTTLLKALDAGANFSVTGRQDSVSQGLANMVARDTGANGTSLRASDASAPSSSGAFLQSELEKRDPLVRQPLTTFTWEDNIPVRTGGGWVEFLSNLTINYGSAGADDDANVAANGSDVMPTIQANFGKDIYKTHIFIQPISINEFDMLRQNITGRSLDRLLTDGVRLNYEKHMDKNVFLGLAKYGTYGLLNNPAVTHGLVAQGAASGTPRVWSGKTADEILYDVNTAIQAVWDASGNDMSAIPNHILLPFAQYNLLVSTKISALGQISILEFLETNNIAKHFGTELKFGVSLYGKGAGAGVTDRMAVYRHDEKFIAVEELQPLTRMRTMYTPRHQSYDTNFAANISEVEMFYTQTIQYFDGI